MARATFRIWRGDAAAGRFRDYATEVSEGHGRAGCGPPHPGRAGERPGRALELQGRHAAAPARREVNGNPRLMCMTRINELPLDKPVTVEPMKAFPAEEGPGDRTSPGTTASRRRSSRSSRGRPTRPTAPGAWRRPTSTASGVPQVHRVLPVPGRAATSLREHAHARGVHRPALPACTWPRSRCTRSTSPTASRGAARRSRGRLLCNITKCCTKVCPEGITITDNAIIPLKERVVDRFYDPAAAAVPRLAPGGVSRKAGRSMVDLKPRYRAGGRPGAREGREALPPAERAGRGRKHLPRRARLEPTTSRLTALLLALTDQFDEDAPERREPGARARAPLQGRVARAGLLQGHHRGRRAKARLAQRRAGPQGVALRLPARGDGALRAGGSACGSPGNDDALLRYNTCVRILERHPHVVQGAARPRSRIEPPLGSGARPATSWRRLGPTP